MSYGLNGLTYCDNILSANINEEGLPKVLKFASHGLLSFNTTSICRLLF